MATGDASDKIESLLQKNRTRVYFAQHVAATYNIEICCVKSWVKIWPLLVDLKKETGGGGQGQSGISSPAESTITIHDFCFSTVFFPADKALVADSIIFCFHSSYSLSLSSRSVASSSVFESFDEWDWSVKHKEYKHL